jgi:hypothetical protein
MRTACSVIALVWLLLSSLPLGAQSLADVARTEAERRKAAPAAGKVLTNDDVRSVRPLTTAAVQSEPPVMGGTRESGDSRPGPGPAAPGEPETSPADPKQIEQLRQQVTRDRLALEALQTRLNSVAYQVEQVSDVDMKATLERERGQTQASVDSLRADIESKEEALQELERHPGAATGAALPGAR